MPKRNGAKRAKGRGLMNLPPLDLNYLKQTLNTLVSIPSPVGRTHEATEWCRQTLCGWTDDVRVTRKGVLTSTFEGQRDDEPRGITAHLDTLGAVIKSINPNGRFHLHKLGNYSWNSLENEEVQVFTADGKIYKGSVIVANASHHIHDSKNGNANVPRDENTMEVRLDAPASSEAELRALGVDIGDYVTFEPRTSWNYGYVRSRFLDDKALVACLLCALKAMRDAGLPFAQRTTVFMPNYEEVGHGGRSGWPSDLAEMLALDVSPVGEGQQSRETHCSLCVADADGPYDFSMGCKLRDLAQEIGVELLPDVFTRYASDAGAARASGLDARFALIGPGVDATHDIERTHIDALEATTKMVVAYLTA